MNNDYRYKVTLLNGMEWFNVARIGNINK